MRIIWKVARIYAAVTFCLGLNYPVDFRRVWIWPYTNVIYNQDSFLEYFDTLISSIAKNFNLSAFALEYGI